ncbi:MAG: phosphate starvation-inducible protein PhoH [Zetaproteobacteria bacterium CG2_30_46_52]|nr:MAG: phosphate starvation-inducible protein PhoH [Zetaproteobacteria bacterium CG2_30_46_52]
MTKTSPYIYVLDTNVLIHDPNALLRFDEHNVVIPIVVLEEMDKVKRGMDENARNIREVSRTLDTIVAEQENIADGFELHGGGRLYFEMDDTTDGLPQGFTKDIGDNRILAVTMRLQQKYPDKHVVLVSKDINCRIKARALGLKSEDYRSDRVVDDINVLSTGTITLSEEQWEGMAKDMKVTESEHGNRYVVTWPKDIPLPHINSFVILPGDREVALRCVTIAENDIITLDDICPYRSDRHAVWGVKARNMEQSLAMNLLMDAELDLVAIMGVAGSGKTLMALAAGLHQTLDLGLYEKILVTRATVPMGQDIGFLPGTEKEKIEPWMGAITDNLSYLLDEAVSDLGTVLGQHRIEIATLSFARGRTFSKTWLIIDEAQNLTPHQMKTLITRMGEGSKILILGNNAQIDTPYLTAHTNGLTLAVQRFADWQHAGHVVLKASERSRLAAYAAEVL